MRSSIFGLIAAAIVIPIVVYAISPYFTESTIDEALPENIAVPISTKTSEKQMESEITKDVSPGATETMMIQEQVSIRVHGEKPLVTSTPETQETMMIREQVSIKVSGKEPESIPMVYVGTFVGVGDGIHDAQGNTFVLPLDDGSQILRLEDFRSTNGPDLYVYLSTDKQASDFVNLGLLKANQGNQNYAIPAGTDLEKYSQVLIWCKAFGVLFGSSELSLQ